MKWADEIRFCQSLGRKQFHRLNEILNFSILFFLIGDKSNGNHMQKKRYFSVFMKI